MTKKPLYQVDAFISDKPFSGNPAAVCLLDTPAEEQWMQNVAMEMNLSETAFLVPREDGYDLRWFAPVVEIALCGHATLASAHVLLQTGRLKPHEEARFHTKSGVLTATGTADGWTSLDFPDRLESKCDPPPGLLTALGVKPKYVGKNIYDYIVEVESDAVVETIRPDLHALRSLGVRGVIVTSRSSRKEYDFVSRFFAPGAGIDEDPVTGSAHCCLGPYWAEKLKKNEFVAYQASPRGGILRVTVAGNRVHLTGRAVTVLLGELIV